VFQYVVKSSCAPAPVPADSASGHRSGQRARPSAQAAAARQVGGQPGARSSGGHQACHRVRMLKSLGNLLHSPISSELSCHTALLVRRSGQASPPADVTCHPEAERGAARGLRLQGGTKPVGSPGASSAHASAAFFQARRVRALVPQLLLKASCSNKAGASTLVNYAGGALQDAPSSSGRADAGRAAARGPVVGLRLALSSRQVDNSTFSALSRALSSRFAQARISCCALKYVHVCSARGCAHALCGFAQALLLHQVKILLLAWPHSARWS
jgi:hypothetical protein